MLCFLVRVKEKDASRFERSSIARGEARERREGR